MLTVSEKNKKKLKPSLGVDRSYGEVVSFLDSLKSYDYSKESILRMKKIDNLLGNLSTKIDTILVGGTNGKSSSIHFASKFLMEEGIKVGAAYSSHFLSYNERFVINSEVILNKKFTVILNQVINVVEENKIEATSFEVLTAASLLHCIEEKVDVILLEVGLGGRFDATNIMNPLISVVTRVAKDHGDVLGEDLDSMMMEMIEISRAGNWFVSADQSKIRLKKMKGLLEGKGVLWSMPIRKLAPLPYIYEQLYGRTASLGERIAQIYVEDIKGMFSPFLRGNLLATREGQRGRPTLEAKKAAELNPLKTTKTFWRDQFDLSRGHFELLSKENPTILLDNARNIDSFENLFLGIRLLHYQKPLKGLSLIVGVNKCVDASEAVKVIRYLLKKVNGQVLFVSLKNKDSHSPQDLVDIAKEMGVKAQAVASFDKAFEFAKQSVDPRDGLISILGDNSLITEFWKYRGLKKF